MKRNAFLRVAGVCAGVMCLVLSSGVVASRAQTDIEIIMQQRKEKEENSRQILRSKEWIIYVSSQDGRGAAETDVITFTQDGKIMSKNLAVKGYHASNFALTVHDGGVSVWETMQSDEAQNLAFLRGELRGEQMTGTISMKPVKGIGVTYNYSSTPPPPPSVEQAVPVKKGRKGK